MLRTIDLPCERLNHVTYNEFWSNVYVSLGLMCLTVALLSVSLQGICSDDVGSVDLGAAAVPGTL